MSVDMKDYIAYQQGYEAGKRDAVSPWHRVEEEPVPYEWVWGVYCQTIFGKTFRHHKTVRNDGDHIIDEDGNIYDRFITHWMYRWPLPEMPMEDKWK